MTKLIWIAGHRKCGTTLMTNLLDGHADIVNYGSDFRMIYAFYDCFDSIEVKDRQSRFLRLLSDDRTDYDAFSSPYLADLSKHLDFSTKSVVWDYLKALLASPQSAKSVMIKETSSEHYAGLLYNITSDLKFIHMVRDPRANWAAIAAGVETYYSTLGESRWAALSSLISRVNMGFRALCVNTQRLGDAIYRVQKFEDLVTETDDAMFSLMDFLGYEHAASLALPTRGGVPYQGNSHDGELFSAVSDSNVANFEQRVPRAEIAIIEMYCAEMMQNFGYELITTCEERMEVAPSFYGFFNQKYFFYDKHGEIKRPEGIDFK